MPDEPIELLTPLEVATVLKVSDKTVYRLIDAGDLTAIRVGGQYRIRRADLDTYLTGRPEAEATA